MQFVIARILVPHYLNPWRALVEYDTKTLITQNQSINQIFVNCSK